MSEYSVTEYVPDDDESAPATNPIPDTVVGAAPEYSCQMCGKELHYGGRGRKPKFCDDHKAAKGPAKDRPANAANKALAEKAADVLAQYNDLAAFGMLTFGMPKTGSAIAGKNATFREQAATALATDPALCRSILSAGQTSARGALMVAYGMFATAVGMVAYAEIKEKRADEKAV